MSLTKVTRTVVDSISSFLGINNTTGAITSVVPDLMPSNSTLYPSFACRAWVNFDGTRDSTGASNTNNTNRFIRGSGNVTSVLRNGTGDYTINFTTAMPDVSYSAVAVCSISGNVVNHTSINGASRIYSISQIKLWTGQVSPADADIVNLQVFR